MPRVIYSAPHLDPEMDGLKWTEDRGELISPELSEETAARYLTIPGFRSAEPPAAPGPVNPEGSPEQKPPETDPKAAKRAEAEAKKKADAEAKAKAEADAGSQKE